MKQLNYIGMYPIMGNISLNLALKNQIIKLYDEMNRISRLYNDARWMISTWMHNTDRLTKKFVDKVGLMET